MITAKTLLHGWTWVRDDRPQGSLPFASDLSTRFRREHTLRTCYLADIGRTHQVAER
jgi:hypothetical protein